MGHLELSAAHPRPMLRLLALIAALPCVVEGSCRVSGCNCGLATQCESNAGLSICSQPCCPNTTCGGNGPFCRDSFPSSGWSLGDNEASCSELAASGGCSDNQHGDAITLSCPASCSTPGCPCVQGYSRREEGGECLENVPCRFQNQYCYGTPLYDCARHLARDWVSGCYWGYRVEPATQWNTDNAPPCPAGASIIANATATGFPICGVPEACGDAELRTAACQSVCAEGQGSTAYDYGCNGYCGCNRPTGCSMCCRNTGSNCYRHPVQSWSCAVGYFGPACQYGAEPTASPTTSNPTAHPTANPTTSAPTLSPSIASCEELPTSISLRCGPNTLMSGDQVYTRYGGLQTNDLRLGSANDCLDLTRAINCARPDHSHFTCNNGGLLYARDCPRALADLQGVLGGNYLFVCAHGSQADWIYMFDCHHNVSSLNVEVNSLMATSPTTSPITAPYTTSPTKSPTNPTENPMTNPTGTPIASPTTPTPTLLPSLMPTSSEPTAIPTSAPTSSTPTVLPTGIPTSNPSANPTATPTALPSGAPTDLDPFGSQSGSGNGGSSTNITIVVLVLGFFLLGLGGLHYRHTLRHRKTAARQLRPDGLAVHEARHRSDTLRGGDGFSHAGDGAAASGMLSNPLFRPPVFIEEHKRAASIGGDPSSSQPNAPVACHGPLSDPIASTGSSPHPNQDGIGAMAAERLAEGRQMHLRQVGVDGYMAPGNMAGVSTDNADYAEIVDCVPSNAVGTTASRHEQAQRPLRATEVGGGTAVARGAPSSHRAYENVAVPEAPGHASDPYDTVDAHQGAPPGHLVLRVRRHTNRAAGAYAKPSSTQPRIYADYSLRV